MADFLRNKIPIILNWRVDEHGQTHAVVTLVDAETYLETDGKVLRYEIDNILKEYQSLLKSVSLKKLKDASKKKQIKKYWSMCKKLAVFNEKINSIFTVQNLLYAYQRDLGLSKRYIRNSISMYENWKRSEIVDGISLNYFNVINERNQSLRKINQFKKQKEFLVSSFLNNTLPPRPIFQEKINRLIGQSNQNMVLL